jgi:hypothetical protein
MNTTAATSTDATIKVRSGKGTKVHYGYRSQVNGRLGVNCGQTPSARTHVALVADTAEVTCTKCVKNGH